VRPGAVTLDLWGTLLADPPAADDRYRAARLSGFARLLAEAGVPATEEMLDRGYRDSAAFLAQLWLQSRDVPVEDHVRVILLAVDPELPRRLPPETLRALVDAYATPILAAPPALAAGAGAAVEALRSRGHVLGIVSNVMRTPGTTLREVLRRHGLLGQFAHLAFSDECRIRKPDPGIFRRALAALGVPAADAVHVGDDPWLDVAGARAAGMRAIQVGAGPRARFGRRRPHAAIGGLAELPDALARLARRRR